MPFKTLSLLSCIGVLVASVTAATSAQESIQPPVEVEAPVVPPEVEAPIDPNDQPILDG